MQETKSVDDTFPFTELAEAGYETAHYGQRAYNGVAVLSRLAMSEVEKGMPERADGPAGADYRRHCDTAGGGGHPLNIGLCA